MGCFQFLNRLSEVNVVRDSAGRFIHWVAEAILSFVSGSELESWWQACWESHLHSF